MAYSYDRRVARLVQKYREDKDRKEWALLESDGPKVLKWFGTKKPSEEQVQKEEARIQYFKHKGAKYVDKIPGGLADKGPPKGVDPKQVEKGIKVELEHTDDKDLAREIAYDHLTEDPKYYDKLETIEKHGYSYDRRVAGKYDHIDFKPPASVAKAAEKGLEYRKRQGEDKAGLTPGEASKEGIGSGVQRAVNLKNRDEISPEVIRQMNGFFSRHEKNKSVDPKYEGEPWKDKGYVAWLLWGGDPGKAWVAKVLKQMESADQGKKARFVLAEDITYDKDHQPGMRVPKGGSSCSTCKYVSEDGKHCSEKHFQKWRKSLGAEDPSELPHPANEYCSDWYEPKPGSLG